MSTIPLVDLAWQHDQVADEVEAGWAEVLATGAFIQGPATRAFEDEFARFCGIAHCVGVGNGTDAIELALRALDIGPGDDVVLPANTFIATAEAVVRTGARPVLVDCDPEHLLIDVEQAVDRMTQARAVIPVHLYGQIAPMEPLVEAAAAAGCVIVEDAAQAQGARRNGLGIGGFGAAAATSFYPGKNLGAYGDAGAVLAHDEHVAERVRRIANHGGTSRYRHDELGFNSRLDTIQAVVLRAKLARLAHWNDLRRDAAARYDTLLAGDERVTLPRVLAGDEHVWHLYPVRVAGRDRVLEHLNAQGIGAGIHYRVPVHLQPPFQAFADGPGSFPVAEAASRELLSLPIYPGITEFQQERIVHELRRALDTA